MQDTSIRVDKQDYQNFQKLVKKWGISSFKKGFGVAVEYFLIEKINPLHIERRDKKKQEEDVRKEIKQLKAILRNIEEKKINPIMYSLSELTKIKSDKIVSDTVDIVKQKVSKNDTKGVDEFSIEEVKKLRESIKKISDEKQEFFKKYQTLKGSFNLKSSGMLGGKKVYISEISEDKFKQL